MPVKETKLAGGKVRVSTPNGVKAKATTPAKAASQTRLLNAIDHNPTFQPHTSMHAEGNHAKRLHKVPVGKSVTMTVKGRVMEHGVNSLGHHHARIEVTHVATQGREEATERYHGKREEGAEGHRGSGSTQASFKRRQHDGNKRARVDATKTRSKREAGSERYGSGSSLNETRGRRK